MPICPRILGIGASCRPQLGRRQFPEFPPLASPSASAVCAWQQLLARRRSRKPALLCKKNMPLFLPLPLLAFETESGRGRGRLEIAEHRLETAWRTLSVRQDSDASGHTGPTSFILKPLQDQPRYKTKAPPVQPAPCLVPLVRAVRLNPICIPM